MWDHLFWFNLGRHTSNVSLWSVLDYFTLPQQVIIFIFFLFVAERACTYTYRVLSQTTEYLTEVCGNVYWSLCQLRGLFRCMTPVPFALLVFLYMVASAVLYAGRA